MANSLSRRRFTALATTASLAALAPLPGAALSVEEARALVGKLIGEINGVINSGKPESAMLRDFEGIFSRYADTSYIALSALGPAGRKASESQKQAFIGAFRRYISVKYGKRFREFIGGEIVVTDAHALKSFFEVISTAKLAGEAPFEVRWHVFAKSGKTRFFNLIIEGINMLASERTEVAAMLDKQRGDIDKLIAVLQG